MAMTGDFMVIIGGHNPIVDARTPFDDIYIYDLCMLALILLIFRVVLLFYVCLCVW
jgi:hypothetical protein